MDFSARFTSARDAHLRLSGALAVPIVNADEKLRTRT